MLKWPKTVLDWVHLFWMLAAGTVVLILISMFVQIIWMGSDLKQWDVLAFFGSIIGGIITWLGVRATIQHSENVLNQQKREKELEAAAIKARILDRMIKSLGNMFESYSSMIYSINTHKDEPHNLPAYLRATHKEHILRQLKDLADKSIEVDVHIYKSLLKLEKLTEQLDNKDQILFSLLNEFGATTDLVEGILTNLEELIHETLKVASQVSEKRIEYLHILFPYDDPETFRDL